MVLIAPELIIAWAARQFFSARRAAKDFNDVFGAQLTQVHGTMTIIRVQERRVLLHCLLKIRDQAQMKATVPLVQILLKLQIASSEVGYKLAPFSQR